MNNDTRLVPNLWIKSEWSFPPTSDNPMVQLQATYGDKSFYVRAYHSEESPITRQGFISMLRMLVDTLENSNDD